MRCTPFTTTDQLRLQVWEGFINSRGSRHGANDKSSCTAVDVISAMPRQAALDRLWRHLPAESEL